MDAKVRQQGVRGILERLGFFPDSDNVYRGRSTPWSTASGGSRSRGPSKLNMQSSTGNNTRVTMGPSASFKLQQLATAAAETSSPGSGAATKAAMAGPAAVAAGPRASGTNQSSGQSSGKGTMRTSGSDTPNSDKDEGKGTIRSMMKANPCAQSTRFHAWPGGRQPLATLSAQKLTTKVKSLDRNAARGIRGPTESAVDLEAGARVPVVAAQSSNDLGSFLRTVKSSIVRTQPSFAAPPPVKIKGALKQPTGVARTARISLSALREK